MDTVKLRDKAAELIHSGNYKELYIKNKGWWTQGYALPISLFDDCKIEGDLMGKGVKLNISD